MRQVRNDLSDLCHTDKERYHKELKKSMEDFLNAKAKLAANIFKQLGPTEKCLSSTNIPATVPARPNSARQKNLSVGRYIINFCILVQRQ